MSQPTPEGDLPQAIARKPGPRSLQAVWIIPVTAALVSGWLAIKSMMDSGPTIEIQFKSAEGLEAGKTRIKHKSVDIGTVRSISLTKDRSAVVVRAELDRNASEGFLAEDTRFWVVRPRIAGGQISGLGTLLAGAYIGSDPGKSATTRRSFEGLETPPPITSDLTGTQFKLLADDLGSLDIASPVYYRGVLAGRVISMELPPDGKHVVVGVFVHAPYDALVSAESRFWNASGADVSVDASGVKLQMQSLATLVLGGISVENPPEASNLPKASSNTQFTLWNSRADAFRPRESVVETYVLNFTQSVRGLAVGAAVDFRGILVGEVRRIDLDFDPATVRFRSTVEIDFWPERMRSRFHKPTGQWATLTSRQRMERYVARGLRGQLRNANLLTGQMFVALDFFDKEPKAAIDFHKAPPEIPTVSGGLGELQEAVANIVKKLEKVPFDVIGQDVRTALANFGNTLKKADALLGQVSSELAPDLRATLEQARKTLVTAEKALATDSPLQGDLRETLNEVTRAAESVRQLTDYLERHPESLLRGKRPAGDLK
jgi:paraquat-inducible protein B